MFGIEPPLRFLVVGCGSIGKRHISNLITLNAGEIVAFDVRSDRRQELESQFNVKVLDNLDEAWRFGPDAVLITVPTSLHVQVALQAAERGCHLFIEKPLSDCLEDVAQLLRIVKKRNLVTLIGCNMRFHPGLMMTKKLLEEGAIGRVVSGRVEVGQYLPDWHPWEDYRHTYSARSDMGGGVILDAIHEIDYIRWMLGEVESVVCFAGKLSHLDIDTEDTAAILLRFASSAIGQVHMDYVQRSYSRSCHIIGDEGTIRWDYTTGKVSWYSTVIHKWQIFLNPNGWEPNQMYLDEMKHYLGCLIGDAESVCDISEAAKVLKIALAAKSSAKKGQIIKVESFSEV